MIAWSPRLSIGIARIDAQHVELVKVFNELQEAMREGRGSEAVVPTLRFLGEYAVMHFTTEEALMRLHGYPAFAEHRAAHDAFREDFARILKETVATNHRVAKTMDVSGRLLEWLLTHIGKMDKEMGAYLIEKGAR